MSFRSDLINEERMIKSTKLIDRYYVAIRPQTNDHHIVHKEDCPFLPDDNKRIFLGTFGSGEDAVRESQKYFIRSNSCRFCSNDHHKEKMQTLSTEIDISVLLPTEKELAQPHAFPITYFLN
jgi:hypothetical protein